MKIIEPLNPYKDGTCRTIKAQYQQSSRANFIRQDGLGATGVIEYEIKDSPSNQGGIYWDLCTKEPRVMQVGNIVDDTNIGFKNPQRGRVYSAHGISPCLNCCAGGGLEPKIVEMKDQIQVVDQLSSSQNSRVIDPEGISYAMANGEKDGMPKIIEPMIGAMRGRNPDNPSERGKSNGKYKQRLEMNENGTSNTITSVQKDNLVVEPCQTILNFKNFISLGEQNNSYNRVWKTDSYCGALNCTKQMEILEEQKDTSVEPQVLTPKRTEFGKQIRKQYEKGEIQMSRHDMTEMEPRTDGVSNTLTSVQKDNLVAEMPYRIRKLTPREAFRLMGMEDADIDKIQAAGISNSQQYKLAGNSIVVDVLYHLFRKLFIETQNEERQLTFF